MHAIGLANSLGSVLRPFLIRSILLLLPLILAWPAQGQMVAGEIVTVGLGGSLGGGGLYRQGCYVPVQVLLTNTSGRNFDVHLAVEQHDLDGDKIVSVSRPLTLNAADTNRPFWFYYWPEVDDAGTGTRSVLVLDGARNPLATLNLPPGRHAEGLSPLDDQESHSNRLVVLLGSRIDGFENYVHVAHSSEAYSCRGGNATVRFTGIRRAEDFPDDVQGLDGVDTVIWACQDVPVGDMRDEFQLKALLDWVRLGGHLIVSVGPGYGELQDPRHAALRDALPMRFTGTTQLTDTAILGQLAQAVVPRPVALTQVLGLPAPGAHGVTVSSARTAAAPLLVTRRYGAGVISLLTIDVAAPDLETALNASQWLRFWQNAAGWGGLMLTRQEAQRVADDKEAQANSHLVEAPLDNDIPVAIDLKGQTALRLALAFLFLAVYWALAGPVGHVVLRTYKRTHWSWWVFGATVVGASIVAIAAVWVMHISSYALKHRSYVLGTVGQSEAAVVSYYGLFAPTDRRVNVALPAGLGYIAPLNDPLATLSPGFADPQTYWLENGGAVPGGNGPAAGRPHSISYPARTTLKKLQARWYGSLATAERSGTLEGAVRRATGDAELELEAHPLAGTLRNRTAYTLQRVMTIYYGSSNDSGAAQVCDLKGDWKPDATLDLATLTHRHVTGNTAVNQLENLLTFVGKYYAAHLRTASLPLGDDHLLPEDRALAQSQGNSAEQAEFLAWLLDIRNAEGVRFPNRVELMRNFTRSIDRSATLRAGHLLILASAKSAHEEDAAKPVVPAPVPLAVDGAALSGDGDVCFAWSAALE